MTEKIDGGSDVEVINPDSEGKHPDSVPWDKYVGVKEAWGKSKEKYQSLEEQLKTVVKPEDHSKVQKELETERAERTKLQEQLKGITEKETAELKNSLIAKGVPAEKVNSMSVESLKASSEVLNYSKPGLDLGNGGGSSVPKGSPMELARQAYSKSK